MKHTLCKEDFLKLLADAGYELDKYQAEGVYDALSKLYHSNNSSEATSGVTAWTAGRHEKVAIDITITCKTWENAQVIIFLIYVLP